MNARTLPPDREAMDFAPGILTIQEQPPSPMPRAMMYCLFALLATLLAWTAIGKLDIIAVAEGKLVPKTYVKIVQPADGGILDAILVEEGDHVKAGQVLMRMDTQLNEADTRILKAQINERSLQLRRIDAELTDQPFKPPLPAEGGNRAEGNISTLFNQIAAQYRAHREAYRDALGEEQAALTKAREDLAAAEQVRRKLAAVLPTYRQEETAYETLGQRHLAAEVDVLERRRKRIETEQDLHAQERTVESLKAGIAQSQRKLAQITSSYHEKLQNERVEAQADLTKLKEQLAKQTHKNALLELRAPQDGIIQDVATHTVGAVVNPGTILMTLVPAHETLEAEVMVRNEDIGFVHEGQPAKLKFAAYPFQVYGLMDATVIHVSADAEELKAQRPHDAKSDLDSKGSGRLVYKAVVRLALQAIARDGERYELTPGMQVVAEINQGKRTVLDYLLSPLRGVFHDAWRER